MSKIGDAMRYMPAAVASVMLLATVAHANVATSTQRFVSNAHLIQITMPRKHH